MSELDKTGERGHSPAMLKYIDDQNVPYPEEAAILAASQNLPESRFLMRPDQLRLLTTLVHISADGDQPQTIVEVGTYTGGSTLAMARGMRNGGTVITLDNNHDNYRSYGAEHVAAAGFADRIELRTGNGVEMMQEMLETQGPGSVDVLLVDANKEDYTRYLRLGIPLVRSGGVVLMDNAYGIGGGVVDEERLRTDSRVQGVSEANDFMRGQFEQGILRSAFVTIGDGLIIAGKV